MLKFKNSLLLSIVLLFQKVVFAQIDNAILSQEISLADSLENSIAFEISNQNFFKNNEYFHAITNGYTLFGSLLNTQISYQPSKHLKLRTGAFFRKDFGNPTLQSIEPLLTLKYQKNGYSFLIGNLEGNVSHQLIEPIFNYERLMTNYNENGIQVKVNKNKIWSDTWINWDVMQYNKSNFQEEFTAGNSTKYHFIKNENHRFTGIFQGVVTHQGGQIDIDTNVARSKVNAAIGFYFSKKFHGFITEWNTQNYFTIYKELAPAASVAIKDGNGLFLNTEFKTKYNIIANVSFWKGQNFLAPRGGELYQSESSIYASQKVTEKERNLLFFRLMYENEITKNFNVIVRMEPYVDLNNQFLEYSYSIYASYKTNFQLFNEKKRKQN